MSDTKTSINIKTESKDESLLLNDSKQCNICFDKIKFNMLVNTPCEHTFCCDCFFEWMKENYTCPCCRTLVIKREENQQRVLSVNRAEIVVQEQEIEELTEDMRNLRRLQKIHKRRVANLQKRNTILMGRQLRMRTMLQETRDERNYLIRKISKIIPDNKLKDFIKKFYKNLINGKSEEAFNEAKNLIRKVSLYEWKKKMNKVSDELCKKYDICRSSLYLDKVLNDILSNSPNSILCKRNNDEISIKELVEEEKEEDKTSGEEEEVDEAQLQQRRGRLRQQRRRIRHSFPMSREARASSSAGVVVDLTDRFNNLTLTPRINSSRRREMNELQHIFPQQTFPILTPQPFQFEIPTENTSFQELGSGNSQQPIFIFGQSTEEVEEENSPLENSGHHGVVISDPQIDAVSLNRLFEIEEE